MNQPTEAKRPRVSQVTFVHAVPFLAGLNSASLRVEGQPTTGNTVDEITPTMLEGCPGVFLRKKEHDRLKHVDVVRRAWVPASNVVAFLYDDEVTK